jgi:uncharacterized protein
VKSQFRAGHRIRLTMLGASGASKPSPPGIDSIRVGGRSGATLRLPGG